MKYINNLEKLKLIQKVKHSKNSLYKYNFFYNYFELNDVNDFYQLEKDFSLIKI